MPVASPVHRDFTHDLEDGWIWVQSDLQLRQPDVAKRVLDDAVADMHDLDLPIDGIWCLGDAYCGQYGPELEEVAEASVPLLETFGKPIAYVMGNHEMDGRDRNGVYRWPLYDRVVNRSLWHTQAHISDFYFERRCFGMRVVFTGDHAAPGPDGRWYVQHHHVKGDGYPHSDSHWQDLRRQIEASPEPVLTVSHYAYPGGQRPSPLMKHLLPLPENVVAHVHGHAHIGDLVHNKERPYQRPNPIDGSPVIQFNISALETARSAGSHSALLRFEAGHLREVRIRCHLEKQWTESFNID